MLYDLLLLCAVWWCIGLLAVGMAGGQEIRAPHNRWLTLALAAASYFYFVIPWVRGGQTLGMKTWRVVVQMRSGEQPGWEIASLRFAAAVLSATALGAGFLWSIIDPEGLTWHDRVAGTRMNIKIRAAAAGTPPPQSAASDRARLPPVSG